MKYPNSIEELPALESFPNPQPNRRYEIEFNCPEWTAVCPKTGFPDFGVLNIKYTPKDRCIELKALKLYINAYRNIGVFHEAAINKILDDLVAACEPWKMQIEGDFNVRGNIKTKIRVEHVHPEF